MENYTVNLTVKDTVKNNCSTCVKETTSILTNSNNYINLQCDYSLKIEKVTTSYVIVSISNLIYHIIRVLYINIPNRICINNLCPTHQVDLLLNSIEVS